MKALQFNRKAKGFEGIYEGQWWKYGEFKEETRKNTQ